MAEKHTRAKGDISPAQADKILRNYKRRPALMSKDVMMELHTAIGTDNFRLTRGLALASLTKPCSHLIESVKDRKAAVSFAATSNDIARYAEALRDLESWIDEAQRRIAIALATRADMDEVLAEGKALSEQAIAADEVAHVIQ